MGFMDLALTLNLLLGSVLWQPSSSATPPTPTCATSQLVHAMPADDWRWTCATDLPTPVDDRTCGGHRPNGTRLP